jgi:Flp pilus assembly protein TadG
VLKLSQAVDDSAVATSAGGTLYITDSSADSVDAITGPFKPGTVYTAISPCNANSAPVSCPNPPAWQPNSLGTINLTTGAVTTTYHGPITPKGMVFVP